MPYPRHALLQFGGTIGPANNTYEEWSCGIRVRYDNSPGVDRDLTADEQEEYLTDTAVPALQDFVTGTSLITGDARVTFAKFNAIDSAGHYVNDTTTEYNFPGNGIAFSGSTIRYPSQVSIVATFETEVRRGYANRGRIYLPTPNILMNATSGTLDIADCATLATEVAAFVADLKTSDQSMGINFAPAVVSKSGGAEGTWNEITAVSVDNVADTQRRRANDIVGVRSRANVDS